MCVCVVRKAKREAMLKILPALMFLMMSMFVCVGVIAGDVCMTVCLCECVCVCVVRKASREAPPPIYNFQRCRRAQFHGSVQEINHLPTSFLLKKEENLNSKIKDRMDYKCQQYSVKTSNLCWFVCF